MRPCVLRIGREHLDDGCVDNERHTEHETPVYLQRPSANGVDGQDTNRRPRKRDDGVDGLEQQRHARRDANLREDLWTKVLNGADAGHLTAGLDRHDENRAADVGPAAEEVEIGDFPLGVLLGDLRLDEIVLGEDVWIARVAVGVQLSESLEPFVSAVVVTEPSVGSSASFPSRHTSAAHLGLSGNKKINAPRNSAGTTWMASGMRHSRLSPVPVHVM